MLGIIFGLLRALMTIGTVTALADLVTFGAALHRGRSEWIMNKILVTIRALPIRSRFFL